MEERGEAFRRNHEVVSVHALHGTADTDPVAGDGLCGEEQNEGVGVVLKSPGHHLFGVVPGKSIAAVVQGCFDHYVVYGSVGIHLRSLHPLDDPLHLREVPRSLTHAAQQHRK